MTSFLCESPINVKRVESFLLPLAENVQEILPCSSSSDDIGLPHDNTMPALETKQSEVLEIEVNQTFASDHIDEKYIDNEPEQFMRNVAEDRNRRSEHPKRPYCTTSSVYAEHTISNPNNDQVSYCIAAILQAQIFDDSQNSSLDWSLPSKMLEFCLSITLPPELGGDLPTDAIPIYILEHEALDDPELRTALLNGTVPTVDTIYRFLGMLIARARFSVECNILALVYVNRLTSRRRLPMDKNNWRGLWVSAIILAQKVWDDRPLKTSSFSEILPGVTREQLNALEICAFTLLEFSTAVRPSVYAKYYFELRQIFKELVFSTNNSCAQEAAFAWYMHPLTLAEGRRLENRSQQLRGTEPIKQNQRTKVYHSPDRLIEPNIECGGSIRSTPSTPRTPGITLEDVSLVRLSRYVIS